MIFAGPNTNPNGGTTGGFVGPEKATTTVADAKLQRDDTYVVLQGNILQRHGHDKYLFQDSTGTIIVDIDNHKWNGLTVTPNDKVEIRGEVDKDWNSTEIDVESIIILQKD